MITKIIAILQAVENHLKHDDVHEQAEAKSREVKALLKMIREWLAELRK